jgi:hypothetical protein
MAHVWRRRLAKYSRWLHIYVSMASFLVVFFFAVTGITLNHAERFNAAKLSQFSGTVDPAWVRAGTDPRKDELIGSLRRTHALTGDLTDFRADDVEVSLAFKGPGYAADGVVDRATGKYQVTETRLGPVAILNDLHKGRDTGAVWKWAIDISAVLLTLVSLTGVTLIYFIHKHRAAGLMLLALGAILIVVAYAFWVP